MLKRVADEFRARSAAAAASGDAASAAAFASVAAHVEDVLHALEVERNYYAQRVGEYEWDAVRGVGESARLAAAYHRRRTDALSEALAQLWQN